jgi:hypothetical protein
VRSRTQVTHPLRFPAHQGTYAPSSLRSLAHTLVPYPRLHLLSLNHVPSWQPAAAMTPRALVDALYYHGNLLAPRAQWESGRLLASHTHFQLERTPHTSSAGVVGDIEESLAQMHDVTTTVAADGERGEAESLPPPTTDRPEEVVVPWYVPWIADNAKHSFGWWHPRPSLSFGSREADVVGTPTPATSRLPRGSCTLVSNSTSVRHSLEASLEIFNLMFRRKAFLYDEFCPGALDDFSSDHEACARSCVRVRVAGTMSAGATSWSTPKPAPMCVTWRTNTSRWASTTVEAEHEAIAGRGGGQWAGRGRQTLL